MMDKYEYLELEHKNYLFSNYIKIIENCSSPNIHDIKELSSLIHGIQNPAVAIDLLNEKEWELINFSTFASGLIWRRYLLKRLKK